MRHVRRRAILVSLGVALAILSGEITTTAQEADSAAAGEGEVARLRDRHATLLERHAARIDEIQALESAAAEAVPGDRIALETQAFDLALDDGRAIAELGTLVEQIEAAGAGARSERASLATLLPPAIDRLYGFYGRWLERYRQLRTEQSEADDPAARAALAPAVARADAALLDLLDVAIDVWGIGDRLGLTTDAQRAGIERRVVERARLAASHVGHAQKLLEDAEARRAAAADPASAEPAVSEAKARLDAALTTLETAVGLMQRLELDDAAYRQLLVASTGALTVEAVDSRIVGELVSGWVADLRQTVSDHGGRFVFQALLVVLILAVFVVLARIVRRLVGRAVAAPHLHFSELLKRMIVSLSSGLILLLGLLVALSQLGIEIAPMLAGLGIAGFVIGFALQDTLGNFAAGVMILIYRPYDVGDMIDCAGGVFGKVSHMSLVATTILTIDNKTLIVPNSKIWGDVITNVTAQQLRRVDLEFGIGYRDDIPHAEEVLMSILHDHPKVLDDPEPAVRVHSLGDSSVNFVVRPWVARDDYWDVFWDVTREVKLRFDREGVSIPFPQRDVHLYRTDGSAGPPADDDAPQRLGTAPATATDEPDPDEND
jgi:small conductance mechanosensitive channel